jgi:hypothetical protein
MKKIVFELSDVDVKLIRFSDNDPYEEFTNVPGREVIKVLSEFDEVEKIAATMPIAFVKQSNGSYLLITKKKNV